MKITSWSLDRLNELAPVYNTQVAKHLPNCFPVSGEEFANGALHINPHRNQDLDFTSEQLLVAQDDGRVLGFVHFSTGKAGPPGRRQEGGFIHFLTYEPGSRAAGQALLDACQDAVGKAPAILAFDGIHYKFYHYGFPFVSDRLGHLAGLFSMNGYKVHGEPEIFMQYPFYKADLPAIPDPGVDIQVEWTAERARPNIKVRAAKDGEEVGVCYAKAGAEYCLHQDAGEWLFVDGLFIKDAYQGVGWGRYLLSLALVEGLQKDFIHTAISTSSSNYRALLFYTNYGYQVVDTVYAFKKGLQT